MELGFKEKVSYGLGAIGKDMVYMLSASYVLYYFQDSQIVYLYQMGLVEVVLTFYIFYIFLFI